MSGTAHARGTGRGVLDGLVVFEHAAAVGGRLLGRMLADFGARVFVEQASQTWPEPRATFGRLYLDRGKQADWPEGQVPDVVVVAGPLDRRPGELAPEALQARWPLAHLVSLSPYGLTGPWAVYPGDDLTAEALGGPVYVRGSSRATPVAAPPHLFEMAAALAALIGLLAVLLEDKSMSADAASQSRRGRLIDVSLAEAALHFAELEWSHVEYTGYVTNRRYWEIAHPLGMVKTRNGWVVAHLWGQFAWETMNALVGGDALLERVASMSSGDKSRHQEALRAHLAPWFAEQDKFALTAEAQQMRLSWGFSATVEDLLNDPHAREDQSFEACGDPGAPMLLPKLPFQGLGLERAAGAEAGPVRPLRSVRVLDLTHVWAGPLATRILADLGATVIKIESPFQPDSVRVQTPKDNLPEPHPLERGWWNGLNVGKRLVGLDLKHPAGREAFLRLVAGSDVLVQNFSPRVMPQLGLDWDTLRDANPHLIYIAMSAFGPRGPYGKYYAFGVTTEAMAGISELTGEADGPPRSVDSYLSDPLAGLTAAATMLAALVARPVDGPGIAIDLSQRQTLLASIAWAFAEYARTGESPPRQVVHGDGCVLRTFVACNGEDEWMAVSARDVRDYEALCRMLGCSPAADPAAAAHELAAWAQRRSRGVAVTELIQAGVPAAPVQSAAEFVTHPQFRARGTFRSIQTAAGFRASALGAPFLIDGDRPRGATDTVERFGASTRHVLRTIAGMGGQEIEGLLAQQAASDRVLVDWRPSGLPIDTWLELGAGSRVGRQCAG